ncbi:hypothetical protein B0H14DRAFT_3127829 [Mycena olivaceomarginata]|nr:hypothetical protein B0H14DRAFT_3127829 [Mycena olivaceomarginata]
MQDTTPRPQSPRKLLLDSLKLLNSFKPLKLVGSIFRRCGWVCGSSETANTWSLLAEFLALLLPHLLAATPDPGLHRGRGLGGALTAHFATELSRDATASYIIGGCRQDYGDYMSYIGLYRVKRIACRRRERAPKVGRSSRGDGGGLDGEGGCGGGGDYLVLRCWVCREFTKRQGTRGSKNNAARARLACDGGGDGGGGPDVGGGGDGALRLHTLAVMAPCEAYGYRVLSQQGSVGVVDTAGGQGGDKEAECERFEELCQWPTLNWNIKQMPRITLGKGILALH